MYTTQKINESKNETTKMRHLSPLSLVRSQETYPPKGLVPFEGETKTLREVQEVGGDYYGVKLWRPGPIEDQGPFTD